MEMINIKINNIPLQVPAGITVLEAAKYGKIEIPTLCYLKDLCAPGACRICIVEVKGNRTLAAACVFPVHDGMEVLTNTPTLRESRKQTLELLVSDHNRECLSCAKSTDCELQRLCVEYGVVEDTFKGIMRETKIDNASPSLIRDNAKCILCRRCIAACKDQQSVSVISADRRGFITQVECAFGDSLNDAPCVYCGQCIVVCPTAALMEKDDTKQVWDAIADPSKKVFVYAAPSIRVTIGESFGMPVGSNVTGKLAAALNRLGFDGVFDMNLTADLTIMEEAHELLDRVKNKGVMPMITSCSPGWVKFCENYFPEFTENLSSCKSPQQMFGAVLKTFWAEKEGIDPKDIFVVSVIPCTAKKFELLRDDESAAGIQDVDAAITTRELARMIKQAAIDFVNLDDEPFDNPFESGSGAGQIFGASGGVMEAALRTASHWLDKSFDVVEFKEVRGSKDIRFATYNVGGLEIRVAATSGLANARELLEMVQKGEVDLHFIEVMACKGGCINGGGQPFLPDSVRNNVDVVALRSKAIYDTAKDLPVRKSYEHPDIKMLYKEFFGEPGSHKAHETLHTSYVKRGQF
ncbi:MAG: [FeFe] hydrogenase, group A [Oscillospiraceae bacterium]|jgi:iron-only hydrogenase group A|nr:[FeFe] hydrogenase, group A [Oscillospiraceae bacterium]